MCRRLVRVAGKNLVSPLPQVQVVLSCKAAGGEGKSVGREYDEDEEL
jgi:hypothetical protein